MYCKKCGRKLDENTRFCDRCGKSVKEENKVKSKKKEIEELAESRIARNKKREEKAKKKNSKKKGISDRGVITIIVVTALIILIIPAVISYRVMMNNSEDALWRTQDGSARINATPVPTAKPKGTELPDSTPYTLTENINNDGYKEFEFDGMKFLYPADFAKTNTGGSAMLKLTDSAGEGVIELNVEKAGNEKAQALMLKFAESDPENEVTSSRAGDGWYTIDLENSGSITHRQCFIVKGSAISYSFSYSSSSKYLSLYQRYISYMDEAFKENMTK